YDNKITDFRNDLPAGSYTVRAMDPVNPNCPTMFMVEITSENNLQAEAEIITKPLCGQANGIVQVSVTAGGSGSFTYQWSDNPVANTAIRNDLRSGAYRVTIVDNGPQGCQTTVMISLPDDVAPVIVTAADVFVSCKGARDGRTSYTLEKQPGFVEPMLVRIKDINGNIATDGALAPGMYCIVVLDGNGCI